MPKPPLHIMREDLVLGILSESRSRELLALGFLRADDWYWREGMQEWQELGGLAGEAKARPRPHVWIRQARESMTGAISTSARTVVGKLRFLAQSGNTNVKKATAATLTGYLPQIRKIVLGLTKTKAFRAVHSGVHDDELMKKVFGAAYDCLPKPIRRFVPEERFIEFCSEHRKKLLGHE